MPTASAGADPDRLAPLVEAAGTEVLDPVLAVVGVGAGGFHGHLVGDACKQTIHETHHDVSSPALAAETMMITMIWSSELRRNGRN
jgi:hypothetical protein